MSECWCGFKEKHLCEMKGAHEYLDGHIAKYHTTTLISAFDSEAPIEREICKLNKKFRELEYEYVDEAKA